MGKSIRCTQKKRLRTAKRQRADAMIERPREEARYARLKMQMQGQGVTLSMPKNAFRHPSSKDAVFPQHEIWKPIDFRSENLPMAGYTYRGNRRKYEGEQKEYMDALARTSHPKPEVMAGGGAVLAATGQKVSKLEAEVIATEVQKPEVGVREAVLAATASASAAVAAAIDGARLVSASAAVAAAVDGTADSVASAAAHVPPAPDPVDAADSSRRPIKKDIGRIKRVAENQNRGMKTSRKHKPNDAAPEKESREGQSAARAVKKKGLKAKGEGGKAEKASGSMAVDV